MPLTVAELAPIKAKDSYLYSVLTKIVQHITTLGKQTGVAQMGQITAPAAIGGITASAANGWLDVAILDKSSVQPGICYFLEWDVSPGFANAKVRDLRSTRNDHFFVGNQTVYLRAYSSYGGSQRSPIVNYGGPTAVGIAAGGTVNLPAPQPAQGSGTSQIPGYGFGGVPNQVSAGKPVVK